MKIAVIGLGSTGLGVCAGLAGAGHEVWGFEQYDRAAARGSSRGDTRIFRLLPGEGPVYASLAKNADAEWRRLEDDGGAAIIARRVGYMAGPPESVFVQACRDLCEQNGLRDTDISPAKVGEETQGWVRLPPDWRVCRQVDCGIIDVPAALDAMARKAIAGGAHLAWGTRVAMPITSARLEIDGDARDFDRVILAAGPWMPEAAPAAAPELTVARRVVAWFGPVQGAQPPATLPILCIDDGRGTFGMQTPGGLFKIGVHALGDPVSGPDVVEPADHRDLQPIIASVRDYLPHFAAVPEKADTCLYTMREGDRFLVFEPASDARVLCMSCCSGHGFKYAPAFGAIARDWVDGTDDEFLGHFALHPSQSSSAASLKLRSGS